MASCELLNEELRKLVVITLSLSYEEPSKRAILTLIV